MAYTVVIPVFNGAATIRDTIASVMAQIPAPQAVIVVDDGSTDDTAEIVTRLGGPITLLRQENGGPGSATTIGFDHVTTPLIATIDADDLWLPGKMAHQIGYLAAYQDVDAVFCPLANFHDDPLAADMAGAAGGWSRSTMLIRRHVVAAVGPVIDPPGRAGEMIDWFARAREQGFNLVLLAEVLALRRIRPGSLTWGKKDLSQSYLQVARAALLRRRAVEKEEGS